MVQDLKTAGRRPEHRTHAPRKKIPPTVALVETNQCSGCEVCIAFCPVDCILLLPDPEGGVNPVCAVVEEECIGCKICVNECPWEAIEMVPHRTEPEKAPPEETS